jgi:nucleotide-binding universal stress UspA family protein
MATDAARTETTTHRTEIEGSTTQTVVVGRKTAAGGPIGPAPILVPLDGSGLAATALPWAVALARRRAVPLLLARVVSPPGFPSPELAGTSAEQIIVEGEVAQARLYLRRVASGLAAGHAAPQIRTVVRVGVPAEELLVIENALRPQLVVMTTHGYTGVRRWVRGSVADKVLRHGSVPVFLVRPWEGGWSPADPDAFGRRVLVPFDGSAAANAALDHAARLAREAAGEVVLLGVAGPAAGDLARSVLDGYLAAAARRLRERSVAVCSLVVTHEDVATAIVDEAAALQADVIVMGTHGRDVFQRWFFGSVADRVATAAPLPILLVRPEAVTGALSPTTGSAAATAA